MYMYEPRKPDQVRNKMEITTSHESRFLFLYETWFQDFCSGKVKLLQQITSEDKFS